MIAKSEVMNLLVESCPSYKNRWIEYCKLNYSKGDEQLLYIDLGDFAYHVFDLYMNKESDELQQVFDVIEQLLIYGDEYVVEAVAIGLLEDIQNIALSHNTNLEVFVQYLKPKTLNWWVKLFNFWNGTLKEDKA